MSDTIRDQISAFLDGELPVRECDLLLRRMRRDGELRLTFDCFGLIGDAIRDSISGFPQGLLRDRVMEAVEGEQVFAASAGAWRRWGRWLQPAAGIAVAASVAVVAVMSLHGTDPALPDTTLATSADSSLYVTVPEPSFTQPGTAPPTRLTNYLMNHSEYATTLGRKSMQTRILIDEAETEELPELQ
ncbi:MAG: sigma-E factor negative regulatory protein [Gammaproteobacteria bacterium]|nr:sigma-E factor negative regulatory protein [Gammaproteobacteria bacterium]